MNFDFWHFLAGLGIFLFGMYHLEKGINGFAGKSFKQFISSFTGTPWKGVLTGTFVTAVLQSSSLVNLLTAAFLGGGLMTLQNAIAVVFGANIGTTFTSWLVAYLGFKLDISAFSYPFLAIGALTYLFMDNRPLLKSTGSFLMGFGLIFLGIDFMKDAVEQVTNNVDLLQYKHLGLWIFIVLGMVITALIQSSTAMNVIVLSALFGNIIDIYHACALSIGANIGTTFSLVLAALKGTADKKRLAATHVLFNVISGLIVVIIMEFIIRFINQQLQITEPVLVLSAFNTIMNIAGVILFFPFIPWMSNKLRQFFKEKEDENHCVFISKVSTDVPDVALTALDNEIRNVFFMTREFFFKVLRFTGYNHESEPFIQKILMKADEPVERYNAMKKTEDEVTTFYKLLQSKKLSESESDTLAAHMIRLRALVYAAKNMKDIINNVKDMDESDDVLANKILQRLRDFSQVKMTELSDHITMGKKEDKKAEWHQQLDIFYHETIDYLYDQLFEREMPSISVSTMTNVIKKTVSCLEEMANAATDEDNIRDNITDIYG